MMFSMCVLYRMGSRPDNENKSPTLDYIFQTFTLLLSDGEISMHEATILDSDARIGLVNSGYSI